METTVPSTAPPYPMDSSGRPKLARSDDFFPNCDYHHLHFSVPLEQKANVVEKWGRVCSFTKETIYEDSFSSLGATSNSRALWLRCRHNLSDGTSTVMLSETWEGMFGTCLRLKESHGEEHIRRQLSFLKVPVSNTSLESQFPTHAKFRFYRISGFNELCGIVNLDETLYGITLNFKVSTDQQFKYVLGETSNLRKADSKLVTEMTCTTYSEHIYGHRRDMLEDLESFDKGDRTSASTTEHAIARTAVSPTFTANSFYSRGSDDFGARMRDRFLSSALK